MCHDIGMLDPRAAPEEAPGLQVGRGSWAALVQEPLEAHPEHAQAGLKYFIKI